MYDETIKNKAISDLEQKAMQVCMTNVALTAQGYVVNNRKQLKLAWSSILLHAFENIEVFSVEQQKNIEVLFNQLSVL